PLVLDSPPRQRLDPHEGPLPRRRQPVPSRQLRPLGRHAVGPDARRELLRPQGSAASVRFLIRSGDCIADRLLTPLEARLAMRSRIVVAALAVVAIAAGIAEAGGPVMWPLYRATNYNWHA